MSRDFILVFSGGIVSLLTTLVVLFITDWVYRREHQKEQARAHQKQAVPPPEAITKEPLKENQST